MNIAIGTIFFLLTHTKTTKYEHDIELDKQVSHIMFSFDHTFSQILAYHILTLILLAICLLTSKKIATFDCHVWYQLCDAASLSVFQKSHGDGKACQYVPKYCRSRHFLIAIRGLH